MVAIARSSGVWWDDQVFSLTHSATLQISFAVFVHMIRKFWSVEIEPRSAFCSTGEYEALSCLFDCYQTMTWRHCGCFHPAELRPEAQQTFCNISTFNQNPDGCLLTRIYPELR